MKLRIACIATALLTAGVTGAQPKGRAPVPTQRTFTLKNGLRVTLIHTGTARKAVVSLVLETGEIDEPAFGPGLASLTADMLLQGTVARSAQQIATEAASLGTKIAVRAGPVTTTISGEVETTRIPRFLSLVADLVRHPLLDTAGFGRVRRHAMSALDSTLHNPADLARQQWRAIIFPDGPFGHPYAFAATLGMLQLGHVRNVYDDNYSASRAHLYVSGVFVDAAAEKSVREIYSDWKAGTPPKPRVIRAVAVHELVTLDQRGADRSVTWIGLPTIDPADHDFASLEVADMLLAGDDSSRVALDLAAIESVPQHGSSTIWQRRGATYWVDVLDVRTANTGAALAAVIGELSALKKEAPSEAEVARARNRVIAAFEARNNSRDGLVALMEFMDEHSIGDSWRTGYAKRVMAVTREDVRAAVAAYLDPQHMAIAIVGDRASIEPQLAKLRPIVP
jgi:predicted Zn-dependent peptidase